MFLLVFTTLTKTINLLTPAPIAQCGATNIQLIQRVPVYHPAILSGLLIFVKI